MPPASSVWVAPSSRSPVAPETFASSRSVASAWAQALATRCTRTGIPLLSAISAATGIAMPSAGA